MLLLIVYLMAMDGLVMAALAPGSRNGASAMQPPSSRIVGGFPANDVSIPYIASIQRYGFHSCGGSIVNERTILTAAHCLASMAPRVLKVKVGGKTRSSSDGQLFAVSELHFHENWSAQTMDYDIGIVRLARSLKYSNTVRPIPLARSADLIDGTYATIAGWGFTSVFGPGSEILRYARVPFINHTQCKNIFGSILTDRMLCAGYVSGGVDACQMDSGGPLVVREQLVGIVSWGIGCALPNKPGIYTNIESLFPWLNDLLKTQYQEVLSIN